MIASLDPSNMDAWGRMLLTWVGQAVLFGTLLAGLTWLLLRTILRRTSAAVHGALWLIVLLKFVMPVGPASALSLATIAGSISGAILPNERGVETPAIASDHAQPMVFALTPLSGPPVEAAVSTPWLAWSIWPVIAAAYLIAIVAVALVRIRSYARFASRMRELPRADNPIQQIVRAACDRLNVRRVPDVRLSDVAPAPFIFGLLNPVLVLSRRQLVRADELDAVVLHEVAHLRRGDLFVRYLQWIAGTVLFFWPVVAWVNRRLDLVREHACDEWALRHGRLSAPDYARCLLRALNPAARVSPGYYPAAMAANLFHVERRIRMILETTPQSKPSGSLGLPAALMLLAWSAFALGGAALADEPKDQTQSGEDTKPQVIVLKAEAQPGANGDEDVRIELKADGQAAGAKQIFIKKVENNNGEITVATHCAFGLCDKDLAEFSKSHPSADVNDDDGVSMTEYNAWHVALALRDPNAVLKQFPFADRNKDSRLEAMEAARLPFGGMMAMAFAGVAEGHPPVAVRGAKMGVVAVAGEEKPQKDVVVRRRARVVAKTAGAQPEIASLPPMPPSPSQWLRDNIKGEPTTAEVARYISVVEEAPLLDFLEVHPEADTNGDGKLTAAERDTFMGDMEANVRAKVLKHHPEADTNGDGVLSEDEMCNLKPGVGIQKWVRKTHGPAGDEVEEEEDVVILDGEGPGIFEIELEVAGEEEGSEPPQE